VLARAGFLPIPEPGRTALPRRRAERQVSGFDVLAPFAVQHLTVLFVVLTGQEARVLGLGASA